MQDDQLLQDLERAWLSPDRPILLDALKTHGITTYSKLFRTLRDRTASADIRAKAGSVVLQLYKAVDKRKAIPSLLFALKTSDNDEVRSSAANALGQLHSCAAVPELLKIAPNKIESQMVRIYAILALSQIGDVRAAPIFRQIMFDETESLELRTVAIEHMPSVADAHSVSDYITLLSHESADIRFWTAYALVCSHEDISKALPEIDKVVAFDHNLPRGWGWHVDRELIPALEGIYYRPFRIPVDDYFESYGSHLISPAMEYHTLVQKYRQWTESLEYTTLPTPPITLHIDPEWLANKLRERWPDVVLNDRQPRPKAYLLDWRLQIDGKYLIGGLHRDRYAVVITAYSGYEDIIYLFAAWYRSIIPAEEPLFLYDWADEGVVL